MTASTWSWHDADSAANQKAQNDPLHSPNAAKSQRMNRHKDENALKHTITYKPDGYQESLPTRRADLFESICATSCLHQGIRHNVGNCEEKRREMGRWEE